MERSNYKVEILEHIATISVDKEGWTKELNLVSWNDNEPVFDLRNWDCRHINTSRGITLSASELVLLKDVLNLMDVQV